MGTKERESGALEHRFPFHLGEMKARPEELRFEDVDVNFNLLFITIILRRSR